MTHEPAADVAVIGGSGFYSFLDDPEEVEVETPYGDAVGAGLGRRRSAAAGSRSCRGTAAHHEFPPHRINYRANLWALRSLGVRQVLAPCAVGGLRDEVAPGDLVVPDQLVDRTSGRDAVVRRDAAPCTCRSPIPTARGCSARRGRGRRRCGSAARWSSSRARASPPAPSRAHYAAAGLDADQHDRPPRGRRSPASCGMCYAAIALVTDMDAGVEAGDGRAGRRRCSPCSRANTRAAQAACSRPSSATCPTRRAAPAPPGRTASTSPTRSREGPAHRVGRASSAAADRATRSRRAATRSSGST